ncbi:MAG: tyrosine--tRNA ligase, partial [Erysipelotrichaceae bacterium]|nr:tyrosine--tRNA ligase [Erysipelotrichaceae bacterium]
GAPSGIISDESNILDALTSLGVTKSKSEARQLVTSSSIAINGEKVTDIGFTLKKEDGFNQELSIIKKGKKFWYIAYFE